MRKLLTLLLFSFSAQPMALAADLWEWVAPLPQGHSLYSITAAEGLIVAVGYTGTVLSSSDGVRWETRLTGGDYELLDVMWGNGTFVAVGGIGGQELDPGSGVILASDDGLQWTEVHRTDSVDLRAAAWNGTRFVAVGREGFRVSGASPKSYVSHDGVEWTAHPIMDGGYFIPNPVFWADGRFIGLGDGTVFVSTDGEEWTELPGGPEVEDVTHGDGVLLGVTYDGGVAMSPDGIVWSIGGWKPKALCGRWVGPAGSSSCSAITAPDGRAWMARRGKGTTPSFTTSM